MTARRPHIALLQTVAGLASASYDITEQYVNAKTSVWWDIENCSVPKGCDALHIARKIKSALCNMGYWGSVSISAYGNTYLLPVSLQRALSSTGVALNHVPPGAKDATDKKILVDMLFWAMENREPANCMLISGDGDFSNALHNLRNEKYNVLLAQPWNSSPALATAAETVWQWPNLIMNEPTQQKSVVKVGKGDLREIYLCQLLKKRPV